MALSEPMAQVGMRQMHIRPKPGQRVVVQMKDGAQLSCIATHVIYSGGDGIVIYHKRNAVDESLAKGWWPAILKEAE